MRKRSTEDFAAQLVLRLSAGDAERIAALAAALPTLGKTGLARAALRLGLDAFEAALAEKDETQRLAQLARLCGLAPATKPR